MRCDEARVVISQTVDGELPDDSLPDVRAALTEHLGSCPSCSAFERFAGKLRADLRVESVEATPDIASGVVAAIRGSHRGSRALAGLWRGGRSDTDPDAGPYAVDPSVANPDAGGALRRRRSNKRAGVAIAAAAVAGVLAGAAVVGAFGLGARSAPPSVDIASEPDLHVLLAWTPGSLEPALAPTAQSAPDVRATSEVHGAVVDLVASHDPDGSPVDALDAGWAIPLDAIAVDPAAHAEFASVVDRAAVADLGPDEALLSRRSARLRGLSSGATLELAGGHQLRVAAVVDDSTIGAAELAVDRPTGTRIGIETPRYLLVAYDGDRGAVESTLRDAAPAEVPMRFRAPDETRFLRNGDAVLPPVDLKERFGEFSYRPPQPGTREFDQELAWQAEHVTARELPLIGRVRCHRDILDAFEGALLELQERGLSGLVDPDGFAGCWNSRLGGPGDDLSSHAWGVSFDINYPDHKTGSESMQDPRLVEVFEQWGFTSGAGWLVPDPAHFEYVRQPKSVPG